MTGIHEIKNKEYNVMIKKTLLKDELKKNRIET